MIASLNYFHSIIFLSAIYRIFHLLQIYKNGHSLNRVFSIIQDAGRTQIAPGSKTVVAILGEEKEVDKVTNTLKLY